MNTEHHDLPDAPTPLWRQRKPAAIFATVEAALVLVMAFGLNLSAEQVVSITGLSAVVLGVAIGKSGVSTSTSDTRSRDASEAGKREAR